MSKYEHSKKDLITIEASKHFSITSKGELSRDSTPYPMNAKTKMGVGFDSINSRGYHVFNYRPAHGVTPIMISSHRLIFYLTNGYIPQEIDYIDQNLSNNHPSNLRAATHPQNSTNVGLQSHNTSGYIGVTWNKKIGKWQVSIRINGKQTGLGLFTCKIEAAKAYDTAAKKHRDIAFTNLNFP